MRKIGLVGMLILLVISLGFLAAILLTNPQPPESAGPERMNFGEQGNDQELAHLLVKLELKTRAVIGEHYNRPQSPVPGINLIYKRILAKNTILPAAVADRIFSETVPGVTGGRAWVKMVVEEPRNPHNQGDSIALELLGLIINGNLSAERSTADAYYYAEPIKANRTCLPCHGEPKGDPDPIFPQFKKNGWKDGQVVGSVIARVALKK